MHLKIQLTKLETPVEVKEIDLALNKMFNGVCLIGRSPNCGLVLNSPEVSRLHARIFLEGKEYFFSDMASKGGSQINNEEAKIFHSYPLKTDDLIQIGQFVLLIEVVKDDVREGNGHSPTLNGSALPAPAAPPSQDKPVTVVDPGQITRWTEGELTVRCVRVIDETEDVKTFCFVASPPLLFTYKPGQFVTLHLEINGEQVLRCYSISSTPSRPHTLEITVKRVPPPENAPDAPPGLVSNWLHDNITVGSEVKLSGPMGKFTYIANPSPKLLMISAGSGITPMMSMSRWAFDTGADVDIVFVHSARSPRDIIFREELEQMDAWNPKFHLAIAITRLELGQSWSGFRGRLTEAMLQAFAPDWRERTVYVCGPDSFMQGVKAGLEGLGFPMQNYYEESFGPPLVVPQVLQLAPSGKAPDSSPSSGIKRWFRSFQGGLQAPSPAAPVTNERRVAHELVDYPQVSDQTVVVFAQSGKEVAYDGEESILDLAEQKGVKIRYGCRMGSCGACKQQKLEGEVKYNADPEGLKDSDREAGYILSCVAYPQGRVVIAA